MAYKEIKVIKNNPTFKGMARMIPDVVFSTENGADLKMQMLQPWFPETETERIFPLVVFVQGCAWTFPDVYYEIPQLSVLARKGYVVATVTHRNSVEGHAFPAFLQDIKTAIRFLRKNAAFYHIDPERVGIWGTSSGGNAALLVGLTADEERYETPEHAGFSDGVKCVVDCFGPTDLMKMKEDLEKQQDENFNAIYHGLLGEDTPENQKRLEQLVPMNHVEKGKKYPPFLLLHGDNDTLVDYSHSLRMFHALSDAGADASMVRVEGAPHEDSFWSQEALDIIWEFIQTHI